MLSAALRRNIRNRSLKNFKQRLLNALAAYIAGYGSIFGLARDLIYLINIDYAALRLFNIIIRRLNQAEKYILDILAHISCLGKGGGIGDGNRHIKYFSQSLCKQGFSHTCRAKHQNIAFVQFNIGGIGFKNALIVIVNRNRKRFFRVVLTDNIFIELLLDLLRLREHKLLVLLFFAFFLRAALIVEEQGVAEFNAVIANIYARAFNQSCPLVLRFTAERAAYFIVPVVRHFGTSISLKLLCR